MPQASNADIIFSDQGGTVSWDGVHSFVTSNLPGNVQLGFTALRSGFFTSTMVRSVTGGKRGSGYLQLKLALVTQPLVWDQIVGSLATAARFATAQTSTHFGNNYSGEYLAFEFKDSSVTGSPLRYGWAELSLANGNLFTGGNFPALTVTGWAYDNTGAQIPMGAKGPVPEPGSMTLLALGALTLGAKGLRSWRRKQAQASQS